MTVIAVHIREKHRFGLASHSIGRPRARKWLRDCGVLCATLTENGDRGEGRLRAGLPLGEEE